MNDATKTTCQFPALPRTVKTYKSQRAATMAVNKADKALETHYATDVQTSGTARVR